MTERRLYCDKCKFNVGPNHVSQSNMGLFYVGLLVSFSFSAENDLKFSVLFRFRAENDILFSAHFRFRPKTNKQFTVGLYYSYSRHENYAVKLTVTPGKASLPEVSFGKCYVKTGCLQAEWHAILVTQQSVLKLY